METFKRTPTIRMLAAEVMATTVELQSGQKDSYQPTIYLSPTGAEVNRVLIAGTAVEKEDVGTDNSFWQLIPVKEEFCAEGVRAHKRVGERIVKVKGTGAAVFRQDKVCICKCL